ncbi:MAG: Ig-like domain-containing protein [Acidimicrobiales bacterium]
MTMRGKQLAPGHYDVGLLYAGDFDPVSRTSTLDVVKNPCAMSVTQSSSGSRPGDPVTFTAALTGSTFAHPGATITFTDGGGGFLASGTVDGSDRVSFSTSGLPAG